MSNKRALHCFLVIFTLVVFLPLQGQVPGSSSQENQNQSVTDSVEIVAIPVTDIPVVINQSFSQIRELNNKQLSGEEKKKMVAEVDTFISMNNNFLGDSLVASLNELSSRELENIESRAGILASQATGLYSARVKRSTEVEEASLSMSRLKKRWELTHENARMEAVPQSMVERMDRVIYQIDSVMVSLQADLEFILLQQNQLSDQNLRLTMLQDQIRKEREEMARMFFARDMPGFFKILSSLQDSTIFPTHMTQLKAAMRSDAELFKSEFRKPTIFIILFFLILLGFTTWYRVNYKRLVFEERVEESEFHLILIRAPLLTTLFLTSLLVRLVYPDLPHTFSALNLMVMLVPTLYFVIRMFHQHVRKWFGLLVMLFFLTFIYEFLFYPDVILRIVLMAFSITGFIFFLRVLIGRASGGTIQNQFVYKLLRSLVTAAIVMLGLGIVGNLVGAFRMAEFFTLAPIQIFVAALAIFVTTKVAGALVYLLLISQYLHRLNFIRDDFQELYKKTTRLIRILLWIWFFSVSLRILKIQQVVFEWGQNVLNTGRKIGAVDITPRSILIFAFVIWLSVAITRFITRILEKDVFVRVTTAKGVPSTIVMLLRIALITGGFFLAAAAAGMELTNLSIVLGAFSVGIGFGLQNIFNNMVSGLILAFERPIKVGDVVQVGELVGTVLNIGLRSSVVKSFDGAEVIVPNGNLISDQMINWTKSDSTRRMDIRIGVAYGTDPEKVLSILLEVASGHEKVNKYPEPSAFFIGFGDSSLDFRLLAWTEVDYRLKVESEINVTINAKLKEAGIEIPFPQRDLHLRSDFRENSDK
jgi:small-conductance mechanosensitive channel